MPAASWRRWCSSALSRLGHTRDKIYKTVARQLHGRVPCWVCGEHVPLEAASLEHMRPLGAGGSSHLENLAISHAVCNQRRHALPNRQVPELPAMETVAPVKENSA